MATTLTADVLRDDLAVSLARAMSAANKKAHELGVDVFQTSISITQHTLDGGSVWRINYGPKDYVNQRGGDVLIEVDVYDATIKRVLRGQ